MMMLRQKINFTLILLACVLGLKAQTNAYQHHTALKGVTSNWHILQIPNFVFPATRSGLEDLRIYGFKGKDTIEVPYILEKSANQILEKEIAFHIINQSKSEAGYYFTFQANTSAIINQLKLSFKQPNFDWKVTLAGSNDNKDWFTLLTDYRILSIKNSNTDYQFTQLDFPNSKYNYYRILIKADEQPTINAAKILKSDTLKGIEQAIPYQSYQLINDSKNKESIITVAVADVIPLSYLKLNVQSDLDFYRALKIEYATDSFKTDKGIQYNYAQLYEGTISSLEQPVFRFNGTLASKLKITIQNNDNRPLNLNGVALKGPVYELIARFEKTDYRYALYYGNANAQAPVYELRNFENKIPLGMTALTVGTAQNNAAFIGIEVKKPLFENKAWLWALMGVIISLLGFFTYKMLKEK